MRWMLEIVFCSILVFMWQSFVSPVLASRDSLKAFQEEVISVGSSSPSQAIQASDSFRRLRPLRLLQRADAETAHLPPFLAGVDAGLSRQESI